MPHDSFVCHLPFLAVKLTFLSVISPFNIVKPNKFRRSRIGIAVAISTATVMEIVLQTEPHQRMHGRIYLFIFFILQEKQ
jgi:hypothetical protein